MLKKVSKVLLAVTLVASLVACGQANTKTQNTKQEISKAKTTEVKKLKVSEDKHLVIMHLNDTHGRVKEGKYDGMGYARVKTIVDQVRKDNKDVLFLDAGDTFHGTVFAGISKGKAVADVMDKMNYTAMTTGNHDYNYTVDRLKELEKGLNFPIVASNVINKKDNTNTFKQYVIKEIDGMKVAIIGVATPETAYKTNPTNVESVTFTNPVTAVQKAVSKASAEGVNYIIVLSHLGVDEDSVFTSIKLAEEVKGIDLIVDGHSHTVLKHGTQVGDTLIVQTGCYDKNLGKVDIDIKKDGTSTATAQLITKDFAEKNITKDPTIMKEIAKVDAANAKITEKIVTKSDVQLEGTREKVRGGETNLGDLIAESMLDRTKADFAITNGGGIRASISSGEVSKGDIINVLPFGNYVTTLEVSGQDVIDAIENGIQSYPNTRGAFPQIAGLRVKFDPSKAPFNRVVEITDLNGTKIDPAKKYVVATNDFMAVGGDEYTSFKGKKIVGEYQTLDDILANYMNENGVTTAKIDGRIAPIK